MKKKISKIFMVGVCVTLTMIGCENDHQAPPAQSPESSPDSAPISTEIEAQPLVLASISSKTYQLQFLGVKDEDVIMVEGRASFDQESILDKYEDQTPLEVFLAVTESHIAIPEMIAKTGRQSSVVDSKRVVDPFNNPVIISTGTFKGLTTGKIEACGDIGKIAFENAYCETPVESTSNNIEFCDSDLWSHHIRNSTFGGWQLVNKIKARTYIICGNASVLLHVYDAGEWKLSYKADLQPGAWTVTWNTNNDRYRRVERTRIDSNSRFRCFTRFIDD